MKWAKEISRYLFNRMLEPLGFTWSYRAIQGLSLTRLSYNSVEIEANSLDTYTVYKNVKFDYYSVGIDRFCQFCIHL